MTRKGISNLDKECPICGSIIWGKGVKVLIEGAKLTVCQVCAKHGKKIYQAQIKKPSQKAFISKKTKFKKSKLETDLDVVPDYHLRIKRKRNSLNLNQDQFAQKLNEKPSLIRRIESAKVKPTTKLATKIEKVYNIKLLKKVDDMEINIKTEKYFKKKKGSSLGDIAFIKKREKKN